MIVRISRTAANKVVFAVEGEVADEVIEVYQELHQVFPPDELGGPVPTRSRAEQRADARRDDQELPAV